MRTYRVGFNSTEIGCLEFTVAANNADQAMEQVIELTREQCRSTRMKVPDYFTNVRITFIFVQFIG